MTTYRGDLGVVKIGANTVGEVTGFEINQEVTTEDDTALGDAWDSHNVGRKRWSGKITCNWDPDDTNGQVAMTIGASVSLGLYPEGAGSGAKYLSGTATVTAIGHPVAKDTTQEVSFDFVGNGTLAESTVT